MNSTEQKKLNRVLNLFSDKIEDYKPKQYRSFTAMRKLNGSYTIQLMFGYNKNRNPIYSKDVELEDFGLFTKFQQLLNDGLKKNVTTNNLFDGLNDDEFQ